MRKRTHSKKTKSTRLSIVPVTEPVPASPLVAPMLAKEDGPKASEQPEMLTYVGLARVTGIRVNTLYTMVCRGEIPCYRLAPRIVRFSAMEIAAWMAGRHQPARGPAAE